MTDCNKRIEWFVKALKQLLTRSRLALSIVWWFSINQSGHLFYQLLKLTLDFFRRLFQFKLEAKN